MKYLSIITNFGCHYNCPYCIVKNNNLNIPKTTIHGLDSLMDEVAKNEIDIISISGGGDPLYNLAVNFKWFTHLFNLVDDIPLELHTSYIRKFNNNWIYKMFDRVVYHITDVNDIANIVRHGKQSVRIVVVVTEDFTKEKILEILKQKQLNKDIDELSFRQLVNNKYETTHYCQEFLESRHKVEWHYIKQDDYNLYYAENRVTYKYEDFKGENK